MNMGELFAKIMANPFSFALLFAICIPLTLPVIAIILNLFCEVLASALAQTLRSKSLALLVFNYLTFPGVMLHETAHALFAFLTGAKVEEIALFKVEDGSLGHVSISNRGNEFLVMLQNLLTSSAPMFVGSAALYAIFRVLRAFPDLSGFGKYVLHYLMFSFFIHMTMSESDVNHYMKGVPLLMVILYTVFFFLRIMNIL